MSVEVDYLNIKKSRGQCPRCGKKEAEARPDLREHFGDSLVLWYICWKCGLVFCEVDLRK